MRKRRVYRKAIGIEVVYNSKLFPLLAIVLDDESLFIPRLTFLAKYLLMMFRLHDVMYRNRGGRNNFKSFLAECESLRLFDDKEMEELFKTKYQTVKKRR